MLFHLFFIVLSYNIFAIEELELIEVKAEKDIERFTFSTYEKISQRKLEQGPTGIISPELNSVPGLVASQNGGPGGRVSFFMRGTEARHLSFTVDGFKINDISNTDRQFDAAFMTSTFIKELNIYKGPQAVLFGSDAMGGLIDMKTKKGENAPDTTIKMGGGSFGTLSSSLLNDWQKNNHRGTLTLTRFHTDGISRLNKKRFNAKEQDSTDITHVTSSSSHEWSSQIHTDFLTAFLNGKAEQDGFADDNNHDFSSNDQYLVQQKSSIVLSENQSFSLRNGFNRHNRFIETSSNDEYYNGHLFQHEILHRLEAGPLGILSGLSNEHENAKTSGLDKSFDLNSVFTQSSFKKNHFKFHLGGRLDKHSRYGTFLTGSGGLGFYDLHFQYSQGYKAPSLYQLYAPDSFGFPIGNSDLVPEVNHSLEASWKKITDSTESSVSVFQNRLSNLFYYSSTLGYLNQERFISEGVEVSGKLKTTRLDYFGSFTHQQFKKNHGPILRRPYNSAQLRVSYFPVETIELNLNGRWFSSRKDIEAKLNPYEVVDFSLIKTWSRDEVVVQFQNLLNRIYEDIYGFSVMSRSVFLSYSHRFN
jgi:vitamin B12 transporter